MRKYLIAVRAIVVSAATGAAVLLGSVQANGENFLLAERNSFAASNVEMRLQQLEAELASYRGAGSACGGGCAPYAVCCHSGLGWPSGFYIGLSGGPQNRKRADDVTLPTAAEFHTGFGVSGMLGHRFRNNLRTEFEFSFLDNNNKTFLVFDEEGGLAVDSPSSGHISLRSFMANLYYDVPVENWFPALWRFRPYVGAGIGTTESRINGVTSPFLSAGIPPGEEDFTFAPTILDVASEFTYSWQVRVGVSYLITNNAEFYAGWRHFETDNLRFNTIPPRGALPDEHDIFGQFGVIDVTGANVDMAEFGLRVFF